MRINILKSNKAYTGQLARSEQVYNDYGAILYSYAIMIVKDHCMAEDVIQYVFMKFIKTGKQIDDLHEMYLYIRKAVRNESFKMLKKNNSHDIVMQNYSRDAILVANTPGITDNEQVIINKALCQLPTAQREVLHMKIYESMTFRDIAELLNESINTISSRYKYAINKLRAIIPVDIMENIYE